MSASRGLFEMRRGGAAWRAALFLRGCLNLGLRFECPCCGWRIARFLHSGAVLRARPDGYCPRCNSKARHRRDWLFLQALRIETPNFRLLHIAPAWCLSRRLRPRVGKGYVAGDIADTGLVDLRFDAGDIPLRDGAVDAVVSIHVLEHVADDRAAAREIRRVLAPGGWAAITVPLSKNPSTLEDASVTSREERRRLFGEATHLRLHGEDFLDRLTEDGFDVVEHPPLGDPAGPAQEVRHHARRNHVFLQGSEQLTYIGVRGEAASENPLVSRNARLQPYA